MHVLALRSCSVFVPALELPVPTAGLQEKQFPQLRACLNENNFFLVQCWGPKQAASCVAFPKPFGEAPKFRCLVARCPLPWSTQRAEPLGSLVEGAFLSPSQSWKECEVAEAEIWQRGPVTHGSVSTMGASRLLFVKVLAAVCTRRSGDPWLTEVVGNPLLCVVLMASLKNPMVLSYHLCNWYG